MAAFTRRRSFLMVALALFLITNAGAASFQEEALQALESAAMFFRTTISCRGGYLWKYSEDLSEWWGENQATPSQIWVQSPGTPVIGAIFLKAYQVTGDRRYLEAARAAADALIWGQLATGGWDYLIDFQGEAKWRYRHEGPQDTGGSSYCTFDDDVTQRATRFLIAMDGVLREEAYHEAALYALDFILESQFDNGAWPQWYPLKGGYSDMYTFNDGAINDCITTMLEAYAMYGDERYLHSAKRGGDFIILSQIDEPQPGWAQQYHWNMSPGWARSYEPPAVCSADTANNIDSLLDLYLFTGNESYLERIPAAIRWLNQSQIGKDLWARFYELGTNRPLYCDRDYKLTYNLSEVSEERRTGYSWQGAYAKASIAGYFEVISKGRESYLEEIRRRLTDEERFRKASGLEPLVRQAIDALDDKGRWVEDGYIYCKTFNRNVGYLANYLECSGWNGTLPAGPTIVAFSLNAVADPINVNVELKHALGLDRIEEAVLRFSPRIPGAEFVLRDDGTGADLVEGDGIYSAAFDPPEEASANHVGVVIVMDVDNHWNLSILPLGLAAEIAAVMREIGDKETEASNLGAEIPSLLEELQGLGLAVGNLISDRQTGDLLACAKDLARRLEAAVLQRRIEVASELIAQAKALGVDTSRQELFLIKAKQEFEKGNYGPARMYTDYPLRLAEIIPERLDLLAIWLALAAAAIRLLPRTPSMKVGHASQF